MGLASSLVTFMSIILFFIILLTLVVAHEFGHFIVAKKSGIRVDEFAFGFPPRVFSKKVGETEYSINALPIGGYVKIHGEDPLQVVDGDEARSFAHKPRYIQAGVVLAGITANLIVAWILFVAILSLGMKASVGSNVYGEIKDAHVVVTQVLPGTPAFREGMLPGDTVEKIGLSMESLGPVLGSASVTDFVAGHQNSAILFSVRRQTKEVSLIMTPEVTKESGDRAIVGIVMDDAGILKLPLHIAMLEGAIKTYDYTSATISGIYDFLRGVFMGSANFKEVSGPVGLVGAVGEAASLGFVHVLFFAALISINLAVINLIPFPALDGGRFLFIVIESVIRRRLPPTVTSWANSIGFILLMLLMVVVTYKDVIKLVHS